MSELARPSSALMQMRWLGSRPTVTLATTGPGSKGLMSPILSLQHKSAEP